MKRRFVWLGIAALALGAATLLYHGPGRAIVRGHVGDVAATMLVYAMISLAWSARIRTRALATFGVALAIEVGQLVWHSTSTAAELTIGGTFDWWDIAAYAIGVAVGVAVERAEPADVVVGKAWHHRRDAQPRLRVRDRVQ
jgi:uncharacterized protein DUF2809